MKVKELIARFVEHVKINPAIAESDVVIRLASDYANIETFAMGFDWDRGKYFIVPEQKLMLSDRQKNAINAE